MNYFSERDKRVAEKRRIRKTANGIGAAFLLGTAVSTVLQIMLLILEYGEFLKSNVGMWIFQILLSTIMFTVSFIVFTPVMNTRVSVCCSYKKPENGTALPVILCGLGVCMLSNILGGMASSFFEMFGITDSADTLSSTLTNNWYSYAISFLGGAALPALVEEFALRGIVLGALKKFGNTFAIIMSSAMFGIMHGTVSQIPFAFVMGLYLGFATVRTGSIWTSVAIHFLNNLFAFFLDIFSQQLSSRASLVLNGLYFMLMMTLGFVGIIAAKGANIFSLNEIEQSENTETLKLSQKVGAFFSSPVIIVYLVIIFLEIALMQAVK